MNDNHFHIFSPRSLEAPQPQRQMGRSGPSNIAEVSWICNCAVGPWSELDRSTMIDVRIFLKFVQGQRSSHFKVKTIFVQLLGESWRNVSSALKPEVGSSWNS